MKLKCSCPHDSPFHWKHDRRPSIFQQDIIFRPSKTGQTLSQASTAVVEKAREEGKMAGFIKGVSRKREEEILRVRNFTIFSLAAKSNAKRNQMPNVRGVDGSRGNKTR